MAKVVCEHVWKEYAGGVVAVRDFDLTVEDGEFLILVGPSGCGKSTMLRMIAGLEDITDGEIYIGETPVSKLGPSKRNIAMVFQNYALYPHMTIYQNMSFSLRLLHMKRKEIHERVLEAADILGIESLLRRRPGQLSGGQAQRVALGRAIVRHPQVFLMDEPLSNLDTKLRVDMRAEINRLHKRLGTTFVYVTHDQTEAMTMGDRIAVMNFGEIQQAETPARTYALPANRFVGEFIGTPKMNILPGKCALREGRIWVEVGDYALALPEEARLSENAPDEREVLVGVRPVDVALADEGLRCRADLREYHGDEAFFHLDIGGEEPMLVAVAADLPFEAGKEMHVTFEPGAVQLFDPESGRNLLHEEESPPTGPIDTDDKATAPEEA